MEGWLELKEATSRFPTLVESTLRRLCNTGEIEKFGPAKQEPWGKRVKWLIHESTCNALLNKNINTGQYEQLVKKWKNEQLKVYKLKPETVERNFYGVRSFWRYLAGNPIDWEPSDNQDLNKLNIQNIRQAIAEVPPEKHGAAENIYKSTMAFYKFLIREGLRSELELLRFKDFKPPKNKNPKRTFLKRVRQDDNLSDLEFLLKENETWTDGRTRHDQLLAAVVLQMAFHTGLRNTELCNLQMEHVNLKEGVISVYRGKGDKSRKVGIRPELDAILRQYLKKRPASTSSYFLTQKDGKPLNRRTLGRRIRNLSKKAGVEIRPHGLRTSFITYLLMDGAPVALVQKIVGHDDLETTQLYDMSSDEDAIDILRGPVEKNRQVEEPTFKHRSKSDIDLISY